MTSLASRPSLRPFMTIHEYDLALTLHNHENDGTMDWVKTGPCIDARADTE